MLALVTEWLVNTQLECSTALTWILEFLIKQQHQIFTVRCILKQSIETLCIDAIHTQITLLFRFPCVSFIQLHTVTTESCLILLLHFEPLSQFTLGASSVLISTLPLAELMLFRDRQTGSSEYPSVACFAQRMTG